MKVVIISTTQVTETAENFCLPWPYSTTSTDSICLLIAVVQRNAGGPTLLLRKKHWDGTRNIFSLKITVPNSLGVWHAQCFSYGS